MPDNLDLNVPFETAGEAKDFIAREIERLKRHSNPRDKRDHRATMNLISKLTDVWVRLYKLENDVEDTQRLAEEVAELRRLVRGGPEGLVDAADN